jgi:DNA-binding MarR family transcriptional regulator
MSLNDLADKFGCTPQNALKMIRALEARKLVTKEKLYRQAWAFYYKRK